MNKAYLVILAIGTAALHDSGRRLEIPVMAASPLDAAVIAENTGNYGIVGDLFEVLPALTEEIGKRKERE